MATWNLERLLAALRGQVVRDEQKTSWVALTGAPLSGKSTVLRALETGGHAVRPEQARRFFEQELKRGLTINTLIADPARLVDEIFQRNVSVQQQTSRRNVVVFDRGLPDVLAFGLIDGVSLEPYIEQCANFRFAKAMVFDRVPTRRSDGIAYHTETQMQAIEDACERIYAALGTEVKRVPLMAGDAERSLERRTAILEEEIESLDSFGAVPPRPDAAR